MTLFGTLIENEIAYQDADNYIWAYPYHEDEDGWAEQFDAIWSKSSPKDQMILLDDWMDGRTFIAHDLWKFIECYSEFKYIDGKVVCDRPEWQWLCDLEDYLSEYVRKEIARQYEEYGELQDSEFEIMFMELVDHAPSVGKLLDSLDCWMA